MFARVFDTARRILSRSPSYQAASGEAEADNEDGDMVTTRRGTGTGPSVESTPASSARKTRGKRHFEIEVQETPTASKRRRKAASKEEDAAEDGLETPAAGEEKEDFYTPAVAIPHRTKRNGSDQDAELPSTQDDVFYTPAQQSAAEQEEEEGSVTPKPDPKIAKQKLTSGKGSGKRGRSRKNPPPPAREQTPVPPRIPDEIPSSTWESEQAPLSPSGHSDGAGTPRSFAEDVNLKRTTEEAETLEAVEDRDDNVPQADPTSPEDIKTGLKKNAIEDLTSLGIAYEDLEPDDEIMPHPRHKRFGSEEPVEDVNTTTLGERDLQAAEDDDDDASDSDEAPEMVTTSAAASKAKAAAAETSRAHEAQQAKEEKRRQQRADRMAEEQAEKRQRVEKKAQKLARHEAKLTRRQQLDTPSQQKALTNIATHDLPDLLPDSILEAAGDHRPPTPPPVRAGKTEEELRREKMNRHIKFLERGEKPVKDVKKGKVNVSVLAQRNMLLAPKANRDTKNIREHWLKGREADRKGRGGRKAGKFRKMERRAIGGGFLRGGDD